MLDYLVRRSPLEHKQEFFSKSNKKTIEIKGGLSVTAGNISKSVGTDLIVKVVEASKNNSGNSKTDYRCNTRYPECVLVLVPPVLFRGSFCTLEYLIHPGVLSLPGSTAVSYLLCTELLNVLCARATIPRVRV